jgi:molecular chaperone DnaJ
MRDPYALLGVNSDATSAEIKRAFRRLAMEWHPDRNPSRDAEERFKQIKAAYELVLDPERLAEWRATRATASATSASTDEAPNLLLSIELEEAASGCTRTISLATDAHCSACAGSGKIEHLQSIACSSCKGVGKVRGGRHSSTCQLCGGRGYVRISPCGECAGRGWLRSERSLQVRIPAGIQPGERLRLARQHRPHAGKPAEDLYVTLEFLPHPFFKLDGRDLLCTVPVNIFRLLHGGVIDVPTLSGMHPLDIEPYPQHGLDYRIPGLGYPGRHGRGAGIMKINLQPVFPSRPQELSDTDRKLLLRLEKAMLNEQSRQAPELSEWQQKLRTRGVGTKPTTD